MTNAPSQDQLDEAARELLSPDTYASEQATHDAARLLRDHSPVHFVHHPEYRPLHVLTRYAHIREVESQHKVWGQGGHPFLRTTARQSQAKRDSAPSVRMLIDYDGDEHRAYRSVSQRWFTPGNLAGMTERIAELAKRAVDKMGDLGASCDFATDIAVHFPLETILSILGLPESDFPFMLQLSHQLLNSDPDADPGLRTDEEEAALMGSFAEYFSALSADRRRNPTDDLASVIANADVPGIGEMPTRDAIGYYIILSVAGHETTSASMAGGIHALALHPDQFEALRAGIDDTDLVRTAADEIIRWVTPVKHFTRTAYAPYRLDGHDFETGDVVFMSYPSANRDERVFDDPYRFDITRQNAGDHLAFGFGAHFCLGAQLARMQVRALLTELVPRLDSLELDGDARFIRSIATSGPNQVPIRYRLDA